MAFLALHVVYTIQDDTGKTSTFRIPFPSNADIGVLQTFAWSTAELVDPLIRGQIVNIGISGSVEFASANVKQAPVTGADVEEGAYFGFGSDAGYTTGFTVPTWDESFVLPASDEVDLVDADVDAFVDRIIAGQTVGLTNVSPSDSRGSDITEIQTARESFRKTRRG